MLKKGDLIHETHKWIVLLIEDTNERGNATCLVCDPTSGFVGISERSLLVHIYGENSLYTDDTLLSTAEER